MHGLFNPERLFWRILAKLADVLILSLLWVFTSLPLVTIGPSTCALYDTMARHVMKDKGPILSNYFRVWKENWKVGILASLVLLACGAVFAVLYSAAEQMLLGSDGAIYVVIFAFYLVLAFFLVGAAGWVFPILSRYENTLASLLVTAAKVSLACLPGTVVLGGTVLLAVYVCWRYWLPILIMPAVCAAVFALVCERYFRRLGKTGQEEGGEDDSGIFG